MTFFFFVLHFVKKNQSFLAFRSFPPRSLLSNKGIMDQHSPKKRKLNDSVPLVGSCLLVVSLVFLTAQDGIQQPKCDNEDCVICDRTTKSKLRADRRILKISALKSEVLDHLNLWCSLNGKKPLQLDSGYICGQHRRALSRMELVKLDELAEHVDSHPSCGVEVSLEEATNAQWDHEWKMLEEEREKVVKLKNELDTAKVQLQEDEIELKKREITIEEERQKQEKQKLNMLKTDNVIVDDIIRVPNNAKNCVACGKKVVAGCVTLPEHAKHELLLDHGLLVVDEAHARICADHLDQEGKHLKSDLEITRYYKQECRLSKDEASTVIEYLIGTIKEFRGARRLDFETSLNLSDDDYLMWTGWKKDQFDQMANSLQTGINESPNRTKREALAMYWIKLKTDLSFNQIASLFALRDPDSSGRRVVSDAFHAIAASLDKNFTPNHLGVHLLSPDQAKVHNTVYSKTFFGDKPTTIWDGTYLYLQKSGNYSRARKTYSMHKHRPLAKFMSVVLPDGYVLDVIGPFYSDGHNNDAGMTKKILDDEGFGLLNWMKSNSNQVIVVDRGFRNVLPDLENLGIQAHMPSIDVGKNQPTTQSANNSRLVTKVRWVVEAYHGRFKKFRFFDNRQPTAHLQVLRECLRSTTAALNAFRPPIFDTITDQEYHQKIADRMWAIKSGPENPLFELVEKGAYSSRGKKWEGKEADETALGEPDIMTNFPTFPKLEQSVIEEEVTFGTYQLKQARHYTDEHMEETGRFELFLHQRAAGLLRGRLQSRHKSSTKYFVWVQHDTTKITGWYCQCKAGMRTLGCCAHVATIIWFLGYGRHHGYKPSRLLMSNWKSVIDSNGDPDSDEETPKDD